MIRVSRSKNVIQAGPITSVNSQKPPWRSSTNGCCCPRIYPPWCDMPAFSGITSTQTKRNPLHHKNSAFVSMDAPLAADESLAHSHGNRRLLKEGLNQEGTLLKMPRENKNQSGALKRRRHDRKSFNQPLSFFKNSKASGVYASQELLFGSERPQEKTS